MSEIKFRDIKLGDPVTITLPAHVWMGFMHWYSAIDESSGVVSDIWQACQAALVDPVFLRETLAKQQEDIDMHNAAVHRMIHGGSEETINPLDVFRMQQEANDNENGDQPEE